MSQGEVRLELVSAKRGKPNDPNALIRIFQGDELVAEVSAELAPGTYQYGYDGTPAPFVILKKTQGLFIPTSYL